MADAKKTVEIVFNGVDKTALATQSAIRNVSSFSTGVQTATQPLANLAVGALKTEAAMLAVGAAATVAALVVASDFQSAALDLQKVLGKTESLEKYKDLAVEISNEYGIAATDVLQSMANFRQAGFVADEAVSLTRNAIDLLIAGDVDAAIASDLLVASLKGFGEEASSAGKIVDLLNGVSNEYATNLGELLTGFAQLAPVAKQAGLSLEETAGLLTPGIEVFRSGSEVATALKTSLINLISSTAPVDEAFKLLGVSQRDSNGEMRSARDIYFDVATALQGVDENQKLYIASLIAGKNQAGRFLAVTEGLNATLHISGENFKFLGSAAEEVKIRLGSAEVAAARVKVAFTNMLTVIGEPLLTEFNGIAGAIVNIFKVISVEASKGELKIFVDLIEGQMKGLRITLDTIAKNLPEAFNKADLSGFTDGINAITGGLGDLFAEIDLTTVDGLAKAITGVGDAFNALSQFNAGVIKSFKPMFDTLLQLAGKIDGTSDAVFEMAGNVSGFATQANLLAGNLNKLLPSLETLLQIFLVKQAFGLVGGMGAAAKALSGSTGLVALLGPAGLVAAAGAGGYAVGTLLVDPINKLVSELSGSETTLAIWIQDLWDVDAAAKGSAVGVELLGNNLEKFLDATRENARVKAVAENTEKLGDESEKTSSALGILINKVVGAGLSFEAFEKSSFSVIAAQNNLNPVLSETKDKVIGFEKGVSEAAIETDKLSKVLVGIVPVYDELGQNIIGYEQGILDSTDASKNMLLPTRNASKSIAEVAAEADKAATAQQKWNEVMLEAKVDLQIASIESQTDKAVAQIEAGALKIKAAYESINTTITSTGTVITDLFGLIGQSDLSIRQAFDVQRQIDIENDRRQVALDLQKKLTEAQIKEMNARSNALARGDGLITIQGDGLQPHLEAFMWEILRTIQVRVNADGLDMLLGV